MTGWLTGTPHDRPLKRPPVGLVVCQIRHETEYAASSIERAVSIRDALGWQAPLNEHVIQGINVQVDQHVSVRPNADPLARGWRMQNGAWLVTLQNDHFAIETTEYPGWEEFSVTLGRLVKAVQKVISPRVENRVGLRFVNQFSHPDVRSPLDWRRFIGEEIFQEKLYGSVGPSISAAMQVMEIQPSPEQSLVVRHGFQKDESTGRLTYILDNDCSRQGARPFESASIMETAEELHISALRAFEKGTTEALRDFYS
ncbi:TIGR04255 family protein [Streptomyces sp. NPDC050355]|uniref:TIGR04255 family protein n=1 Tax=Streptomyces TaxID=1883 RepID=UPI0037AC7AD1